MKVTSDAICWVVANVMEKLLADSELDEKAYDLATVIAGVLIFTQNDKLDDLILFMGKYAEDQMTNIAMKISGRNN